MRKIQKLLLGMYIVSVIIILIATKFRPLNHITISSYSLISTSLLWSFLNFKNNRWTPIVKLLTILIYTYTAYLHGIYSEVVLKVLIFIPVSMYSVYRYTLKRDYIGWSKRIKKEVGRGNRKISRTQFFFWVVFISLCYALIDKITGYLNGFDNDILTYAFLFGILGQTAYIFRNRNYWNYSILYYGVMIVTWSCIDINDYVEIYFIIQLIYHFLGGVEMLYIREDRTVKNTIFAMDMRKLRNKTKR